MSEEDLERYESEIELGLVQEYRAVLPVFSYVIETWNAAEGSTPAWPTTCR
jgi:hypothetical protein